MAKKMCFQVSRGGSCELPSCDHKRVELQIIDWTGCDGNGREESFDVSTWTPEQFQSLRTFVAAGASVVPLEDLRRIEKPYLRLFHLVHMAFGPDLITHFYAKDTIRDYKRMLRKEGFGYPRYRRYRSEVVAKDVLLRGKSAVASPLCGGATGPAVTA